jgi:hypothetical protein
MRAVRDRHAGVLGLDDREDTYFAQREAILPETY